LFSIKRIGGIGIKTIGLLGGLTWESTLDYYRLINEMTYERLGGRHSSELILMSVDFDPVNNFMANQEWEKVYEIIKERALKLQVLGAECLLICCNTMHFLADKIAASLDIPLINIIDVIGDDIRGKSIKTVGLLGSSHTMKMDFYREKLLSKHGIKTIIPSEVEISRIMEIIENELGQGIVKDDSRKEFLAIIDRLVSEGAEGVILGCTEIPILVRQSDTKVDLFKVQSLFLWDCNYIPILNRKSRAALT